MTALACGLAAASITADAMTAPATAVGCDCGCVHGYVPSYCGEATAVIALDTAVVPAPATGAATTSTATASRVPPVPGTGNFFGTELSLCLHHPRYRRLPL